MVLRDSGARARRAAAALLAGAILAAGLAGQTSAAACEGAPSAAKLVVEVDNVRAARGLMTASLYPDDPGQFLIKNGALKVWSVPATAPTSHLCIWLPAAGVYAVAVYQDLNSNHRLDMGALGPREPYGLSRNPHIFFGKPSLASVRFPAKEGVTTVRIRLNDPF